MIYSVVIEEMRIVEVNASSEEAAIETVKKQLDAANPRNTAKLSIAKEVTLE